MRKWALGFSILSFVVTIIGSLTGFAGMSLFNFIDAIVIGLGIYGFYKSKTGFVLTICIYATYNLIFFTIPLFYNNPLSIL